MLGNENYPQYIAVLIRKAQDIVWIIYFFQQTIMSVSRRNQ